MDPKQIQKEVDSGEAILIDVREKSEWDGGHIAGAKHIPLGSINATTTKDFPKDTMIYVYCRSGGRAVTAEAIFRNLGFLKVENIGGVIDWEANGGELVK